MLIGVSGFFICGSYLARCCRPGQWPPPQGNRLKKSRITSAPEKCEAVFPRDMSAAFARRLCSNNKLKRQDHSSSSHRALVMFPVLSEFCWGTAESPRNWCSGQHLEDETMKLAIALAAVAGLALAVPAANADETRVGVGVGPVGAGVTVGESHDRDRTTVIKKEHVDEPREHTTIIKKEREEPGNKVIIKEHEH